VGHRSSGERYNLPISGYDIGMLRQFLRGAAQVHVLHHAAEGAVHGAWLAVELGRHGYRISPGTLYPLLHRMEAGGLLASHEELVEGRLRRVYVATEEGRAELGRLQLAVAELAAEILADEPSGSLGRAARSGRAVPGS
jgi:DNA-binding PadR family transcriptional regulator